MAVLDIQLTSLNRNPQSLVVLPFRFIAVICKIMHAPNGSIVHLITKAMLISEQYFLIKMNNNWGLENTIYDIQ